MAQKNPFKSQENLGLLQSSEPSLPDPRGASHPKSKSATSHDQKRLKCCLVCWRWADNVLNDTLKAGIHSLFGIEFDYSDRRIPLGICSTCRRGIYDFNKTKANSKNLELLHKNVDFIKIPATTRSEQVCSCTICNVAKGPVKAGKFQKYKGAAKKLEPIPEVAAQKPTGTRPKVQAGPKVPKATLLANVEKKKIPL